MIPLSNTEIKKTRDLLSKGCQIGEIALAIQRSEETVEDALEADKELQGRLKPFKTGRWSKLENEVLLSLSSAGEKIDTGDVAKQLGRNRSSVIQRLKTMGDSGEYPGPAFIANPPSLPQELLDAPVSDEQQTVIVQRLSRIIEAIMTHQIKDERWRVFLTSKSAEQCIVILLPLIPRKIKRVLAASRFPTVADWKRLGREDTNYMGVFAWVLKRRLVHPLMSIPFVCIGAATGSGDSPGFNSEKESHKRRQEYYSFDVGLKAGGLWRQAGPFITLLNIERASEQLSKEMAETNYLVMFAEAIFSTCFGALHGNKRPDDEPVGHRHNPSIDSLSPWNTANMTYRSLLSPSRLVSLLGHVDSIQERARLEYSLKNRRRRAAGRKSRYWYSPEECLLNMVSRMM